MKKTYAIYGLFGEMDKVAEVTRTDEKGKAIETLEAAEKLVEQFISEYTMKSSLGNKYTSFLVLQVYTHDKATDTTMAEKGCITYKARPGTDFEQLCYDAYGSVDKGLIEMLKNYNPGLRFKTDLSGETLKIPILEK